MLIMSDKNKNLHLYKDENEIKVIKDCSIYSVTYDNGYLIGCYRNIIYAINLKTFTIEKQYEVC